MNSKGVIRLFNMQAGDWDTNHARGYIVFPTARRDAIGHRSDEAVRAGVIAGNFRDASWAAFVKAGW